MAASANVLELHGLKKHYVSKEGFFKRRVRSIKAVDGVSFSLGATETLGLVGESGCGKTTLVKCVLRAINPDAGSILVNIDGRRADMAVMNKRELKAVRRGIQMVFQDPHSSLNPRMTVQDIIGEPLLENGVAEGEALRARVEELLTVVGLDAVHLKNYPHAFSGGQRQRIGIARAIALNPKIVLADEPVSALDVSVQAQILNLLKRLQNEFDLSYLFIAHDLSVVQFISHRVAVMYVGKLVEVAETDALFVNPAHPYTEALLASVPYPDPRRRRKRQILQGEVADPGNLPQGCHFHPRCRYAVDRCRKEQPTLQPLQRDPTWRSACHFRDTLTLTGIEVV